MALKIFITGAGPAGLYLAFLLKRSSRDYAIRVVEQNARDSTFGFGLAFSQRALDVVRNQDEELWTAVWPALQFWDESIVSLNGRTVRIDGMGYAGIGRLALLRILQRQSEKLGVEVEYSRANLSADDFADADLVVGADGANSAVRGFDQNGFGTGIFHFSNRFAWFGTRRLFNALTHTFLETPYGAFNAHHHRHAPDMSTFVVEVDEATFYRCEFDKMPQQEAQRRCESVFAAALDGESLISNKSIWRRFPRITNSRWSSGNRVLLGDALHTAHFSIGSGTRMAMADALALATALNCHYQDVPLALMSFEQARRPKAERLIAAADASANWYENFAAHMRLPAMEFAMSYITRSGRVDPGQLRRSSASFMDEYERHLNSKGQRPPHCE